MSVHAAPAVATAVRPARRHLRLGGTGLFLLMSFATIIAVAAIAAFCVSASWALLPIMMLVLILMAAGVVAALARVLDE